MQSSRGIALDGKRGLANLAELAGIDIDVNDLRIRRESIGSTCRAVIEACTDCNQQVAFFDHLIRIARRVHAQHTEAEYVLSRQRAERHECGRHRNLIELSKLTQQ